MTLTDFLLARIAEDEAVAARIAAANSPSTRMNAMTGRGAMVVLSSSSGPFDPARVLAECEAKRRIVEWHKSWPVLVQQQPKFDRVTDAFDLNSITFRASQQMSWTTEQAYRDQFGTEPPTGPVLRFLALPYAEHPDYCEEWRG